MPKKYYILATSPLGQRIHVTRSYWEHITKKKHPEIKNQRKMAIETLENPDIIKHSPSDETVFLYYLKPEIRYFCVVAKHLDSEGFIITAYITKKFAKGEVVWQSPKK